MPTRTSHSASLLPELYDLEEDVYRLSLREAERLDGPPAIALRTIVAHANAMLDELPTLARGRSVDLDNVVALARDTWRQVRDAVADRFHDRERAYLRALTTARRGIDVARLIHAAANHDGDTRLAAWCEHWISARTRLVDQASSEIVWFAEHPLVGQQSAA
jgi:hypothetical protein